MYKDVESDYYKKKYKSVKLPPLSVDKKETRYIIVFSFLDSLLYSLCEEVQRLLIRKRWMVRREQKYSPFMRSLSRLQLAVGMIHLRILHSSRQLQKHVKRMFQMTISIELLRAEVVKIKMQARSSRWSMKDTLREVLQLLLWCSLTIAIELPRICVIYSVDRVVISERRGVLVDLHLISLVCFLENFELWLLTHLRSYFWRRMLEIIRSLMGILRLLLLQMSWWRLVIYSHPL